MPVNVAFFLPHFGHGGVEGVVLRLLRDVDRRRFAPVLVLQRRRGELLGAVPDDVPVLALRRARAPFCVVALARLYARRDIALAVTATNAANLYSIVAAALSGAGTRTLISEHTPLVATLDASKLPRIRRAAVRRAYPRATLSAGPVAEIGAELRALLGSAAPAFVTLPNPVTDDVREIPRPPCRAAHVISVGRLAPEKRFDLLIDAFAALAAAEPAARLTIYGEGPERAALEARIAARDLTSRARLAGYTDDIDGAHAAADLFVCTSSREGLGNAIIEAMARGTPVVSVDCPFGPRRLLCDGEAGWLVSDDRPEKIARAIATVLHDHGLRRRYVEAGLAVARGYSASVAVAAYEAAFERALAR